MPGLYILLIVFIVAFAILFIWNLFTFKEFKQQSLMRTEVLNDSKYWELKYKQEFIIAIIGIVTVIAGILGYTTLQSVKDELTKNTKEKIDSAVAKFDSTKRIIDTQMSHARKGVFELDTQLTSNTKKIQDYSEKFNTLIKKSSQSGQKLANLNKALKNIQDKAILKQPMYFINEYPLKGRDGTIEITFKTLTTSNGQRLPTFNKPPLVLFPPDELSHYTILKTTADGFRFTMSPDGMNDVTVAKTIFKPSFLIIERPN